MNKIIILKIILRLQFVTFIPSLSSRQALLYPPSPLFFSFNCYYMHYVYVCAYTDLHITCLASITLLVCVFSGLFGTG